MYSLFIISVNPTLLHFGVVSNVFLRILYRNQNPSSSQIRFPSFLHWSWYDTVGITGHYAQWNESVRHRQTPRDFTSTWDLGNKINEHPVVSLLSAQQLHSAGWVPRSQEIDAFDGNALRSSLSWAGHHQAEVWLWSRLPKCLHLRRRNFDYVTDTNSQCSGVIRLQTVGPLPIPYVIVSLFVRARFPSIWIWYLDPCGIGT